MIEEAKMRFFNTVIILLMLITFIGCGDKDEAAQETAAIPQIDLHSAVVTDNFDVIRQHIAASTDLNVLEPSHASTPLITAAALGKTEAAKMLVDAGADLNYQNADGSTALHTAAAFGRTDIAKILIDAGADLDLQNNEGATALHAAAFLCRPEIVEALLEKGADKTIKNKTGQTAYQTMIVPFNDVKFVYDAIGAGLKPLGVVLDYDHIQKTRPQVAAMLK
ncbi:ankyrin repeat domain-containing protein [candidate division KSB1 bacterium]|nr:ankyrin repeat domain-containing protein [candidate division KSB1 bacterium]